MSMEQRQALQVEAESLAQRFLALRESQLALCAHQR